MSEAEYEVRVNALTGSETDVEEVFFAGVHCGTFRFYAQRTHYLQIPFQMLGVDLWRMARVTVSPAFPFDG